MLNGLFGTTSLLPKYHLPSPLLIRPTLEMYAAPPADPRFSPLLYPSHAGLAPAYIHAMGMDSLRDDAIIYERALREAGVKTQIKV